MKRILILSLILMGFALTSSAQDYNTGVGLRFGLANGLTVKHFMGEKAAIEGILTTRWKGFMVTGLFELHNGGLGVDGLKWYYGLGGHVGFWNGDNVPWSDNSNAYTVIGVDGVLGLEYKFADYPFTLSLDWKPAFNIIGYSGFWADEAALSVRYTF